MEGCEMGGLSEGVKSEMEGREGGNTEYGGDTVTGVGKYGEGTRVRPGVTCEYMVGGVAVVAVPDGGGGS